MMLKHYIFSFFLIVLVHELTAQVGVNTQNPTSTLDVNGNVRIRTTPAGVAADDVLTTDANGNIRQRTAAEVVIAGGGVTDNVYTADGTLTGNRTIITSGNLFTLDLANDGSNRFRIDDTDVITFSRNPGMIAAGLMSSSSSMYYTIDNNNNSGASQEVFSWGSNASPTLGTSDPNFQELMNLNEFGELTLAVPDSRLRFTAANSNIVRVQPSPTSDTWDLTLPENNGIDGQVLTTDGLGNSRWESNSTPLETLATAVLKNTSTLTYTTTNGNPGSTPGELVNMSLPINFSEELVDPGNNFDLVTNIYTAPITGSYLITLTASPNSSPGNNQTGFYYPYNLQVVNVTTGVILADNRSIRYATPGSLVLGSAASLQGIVNLTAGDQVSSRIAIVIVNAPVGALEGISCPDQITFAPQTENRVIFSIVKL